MKYFQVVIDGSYRVPKKSALSLYIKINCQVISIGELWSDWPT